MADSFIGFELLLHCSRESVKKKEDILLLLVHHSLLKAGFRCAGNGENWNDNDTRSEILPSGWNSSKDYNLRYQRGEDRFILMTNKTDDVIVFNFTSTDKMKVTNVIFNVEESVKSVDGSVSTMIPEHEDMLKKINQQLVTPFAVIQKVDTNTQTTDQQNKVGIIPQPESFNSRFTRPDRFEDITSIGRRDLDPLAAMGGSGGMFFDPLRENRGRLLGNFGNPQRLPRGAIPPGARFDPFGPPDTNIIGRPPPDYDDMFG